MIIMLVSYTMWLILLLNESKTGDEIETPSLRRSTSHVRLFPLFGSIVQNMPIPIHALCPFSFQIWYVGKWRISIIRRNLSLRNARLQFCILRAEHHHSEDAWVYNGHMNYYLDFRLIFTNHHWWLEKETKKLIHTAVSSWSIVFVWIYTHLWI